VIDQVHVTFNVDVVL